MPLMRCEEGGKKGWKYGDSGKCYLGPGAKKKAIKQGLAESYRSGEKFEPSSKKAKAMTDVELEVAASRLISRQESRRDDLERAMMDRMMGLWESEVEQGN